jgi:hypothetical protein
MALYLSGTEIMLLATAAKPRRYSRRPRHTAAGTIELPRSDGRTLASRRFRHLCEALEAELGTPLSEVDQNLVRQAAGLVLAAEKFQADVVNGAEVGPDALVRVSSEARRILSTLRAKAAKNKPQGPTLQEYLATKYGDDEEGEVILP